MGCVSPKRGTKFGAHYFAHFEVLTTNTMITTRRMKIMIKETIIAISHGSITEDSVDKNRGQESHFNFGAWIYLYK